MSNVMKIVKFDIQLLKPYLKSIAFLLVVPTILVFLNRSLFSAVSFSVCVIAMSANYPFAIEEKSGMERLYGFLPVSVRDLVRGRYITSGGMGLVALCFSLVMDTIILMSVGVSVTEYEILLVFLFGAMMHSLYIVFQIPGYYRFGSIKGKALIYLPVVGFLGVTLLMNQVDSRVLLELVSNPFLMIGIALVFIVIAYSISITISIKIVNNKARR